MTIRATKPTSMSQAFARVQDHLNDVEADDSHLNAFEQAEMFRDFAMAVHYIARDDVIHQDRHFFLWLAGKLKEDFPEVDLYDADGNRVED